VVRGTTIAVIATATWPPRDPSLGEARERVALSDPTRLLESIRTAKKNDAVVIVSQGGAAEYVESPPPEEIAFARSAIEAGADAVLVHGAHVPLGVAWVAGHPIFYGLGNLVADDDPKNPWTGRGFVAKVGLTKRGVGPVDLCPFLIGNPNSLPARPARRRKGSSSARSNGCRRRSAG
jgi:poly-gamma-glutamate capsule biosynthesis protein CapA/YwtB (metallophosphatase superfamily)